MTTNQPASQVPAKSIANFLNAPLTAKFLQETLAEKKPEFVSNLIALCDADKNLANCDPGALMKCAMNATALNLPLNKNLGYAYVIPYEEKVKTTVIDECGKEVSKEIKIKVPQFQIGYKGLIQLAIRTGYYKHLNAVEIRKGEIARNKITGEIQYFEEKPNAEIIGYISYLELLSGFKASYYMDNDDLEQHALRFSKMYQYDKKYTSAKSKWSDPLARPAMCKKTVLKLLLSTYGLMTTEFARAFESDNEETESQGNRFEEAVIVNQPDPSESVQQSEPVADSLQLKTVKI